MTENCLDNSSTIGPSIVLKGELRLLDQEGGRSYPALFIGNEEIGEAVEEMCKNADLVLSDGHESIPVGQWILTLVRYRVK